MLAVIGEAIIDLVADPSGPGFTAHPGGSPLNVAVGLARLGQPTALIARLSTGTLGTRLRDHAAANGVALDWSVSTVDPASLAVVSTDPAGHARYEFYIDGTADWAWSDVPLPPGTRAIHAGSLAAWRPPGDDHILDALAKARANNGTLISFDPNVRPTLLNDPKLVERYLPVAHVVKTSEEDLRWLYPEQRPTEAANEWLSRGPHLVVVTFGAEGYLALRPGHDPIRRPAVAVPVTDTVGAGDAFTAALIDGLMTAGTPVNDLPTEGLTAILDRAALAAAITCARPGADPPTLADLNPTGSATLPPPGRRQSTRPDRPASYRRR
jgi:fructokinase